MATEESNPSILKPIDSPQEQVVTLMPFLVFLTLGIVSCLHGIWYMGWTPCLLVLCVSYSSLLLWFSTTQETPEIFHIIRENFEWTDFHILLSWFMLILTGFDQKFLCQQAYLVSSHEENSITSDSMKTLHFKALFYKYLAEPFLLYPSCPCSNKRAGE